MVTGGEKAGLNDKVEILDGGYLNNYNRVKEYIAQVIMVLGFREQWIYWLILDIGSVVLAICASSWVMTAQFIFWCVNCIYGFTKWHKSATYENYEKIA